MNENQRAGKTLNAHLTNGVQDARAARVDESRAVIAQDTKEDEEAGLKRNGKQEVIDISSAEDESSAYESSDDELQNGTRSVPAAKAKAHNNDYAADDASDEEGSANADAVTGAEDVRMEDAEDVVREDGEDTPAVEPSFGELLQASHPEPIDVQALFADPMADARALVPSNGDRVLAAPSATSLGTVLTQALKTNDKDLLESCFQMNDVSSIRSTIQRLHSSLVASLLQRLAERIHKRPGRTGNLMVWVQWSLVAHGGYIASQPEVMKKLKSLSQVVRERASGLQPLLSLKGKLDMLSAQLELRKSMQTASRLDEDGDDEAVIYVEGEEDDLSEEEGDDDEVAMADADVARALRIKGKTRTSRESDEDASSEEDDEMPTTNGALHDEDDDSEDEEQEADAGMFDEEAAEVSDDEGDDSAEEAGSDIDSEADEDASMSGDSSASSVKPQNPKVRNALNRKR